MAFYPKHRDVLIAEYSYRHEAEFATGMLREKGIAFDPPDEVEPS